MLKGAAALGVLGVGVTGTASAQDESWAVSSPHDTVTMTVTLDGGEISYTVSRNGSTVVNPSPLGITTSAADFIVGLGFESEERETVSHSYETVHGKQREHSYEAEELSLTFSTAGESVILDVRTFEDGVGYRYRLPGDGVATVEGEATGFTFPASATAWLGRAENWLNESTHNYESFWEATIVGDADGDYSWGSLFERDENWVLLGESDVRRQYCTTRPSIEEDESVVTVSFPEDAVSAPRPLATPWRVIVTGNLNTIVESDLITHLASPAEFEDTSWIEPGRVAWSWWSQDESPSDFEIQQEFVDYAAEQGWEYTLVDAGWEAEWMPNIVQYANDRNVDIILWSDWADLNTDEAREELLSRWAEWGAAGIKVDYMDSDEQDRMVFYHDLLEAAAEYELMVNFHGSTPPKGWKRQWPHLMTKEGVLGAEHYKWESYPASHNVTLPFTRNVLGPMDYTPVTFSADGRETTDAHELALSVVFESGHQHFADDVDVYAEYPLAERFLSNVPAAWDETQFLGGRPDESVTIARRSGEEWFVGHIGTDTGTVEVPLWFLDSNTEYDAEITTDRGTQAPDTGLRMNETVVTRSSTVTDVIRSNGGFTVHLYNPYHRGSGDHDEPGDDVSDADGSNDESDGDDDIPGFGVGAGLAGLLGGALVADRLRDGEATDEE